MNRFIPCEMFKLPWFSELSTNAMALAVFIHAECDKAGFWDRNDKVAKFLTNMSEEDYQQALASLLDENPADNIKHFVSHKGVVWFRDHLEWARNVPVKRTCRAHKSILETEAERYKKSFFDCPEYARPIEELPNGDLVHISEGNVELPEEPVVVELKPASKPKPKHAITSTRLSRNELMAMPKDWKAIKERCLGMMQPGLKSGPIYEALKDWYDHCLEIGCPYEITAWRGLVTEIENAIAQYRNVDVAVQAIRYSIAHPQMGTKLNYGVTNEQIKRDTEFTKQHHRLPLDFSADPKPNVWKPIVKEMYPNIHRMPARFRDLPERIRGRVEEKIYATTQ